MLKKHSLDIQERQKQTTDGKFYDIHDYDVIDERSQHGRGNVTQHNDFIIQ